MNDTIAENGLASIRLVFEALHLFPILDSDLPN